MQASFCSCGWIGLLIFLRNEKKQCAKLWVDCKKCDRKKQQQGGLCGSRQKDHASPALRQAQRTDEKGRGFLAAGDSAPAELPVINPQVKPDRFQLDLISVCFNSDLLNKTEFYIWISENTP